VNIPTSPGDESRIGVRPDGAYWGGGGEQIDMQSGNLNFSIPLFKALGRGAWGVTFALSYNSQMWRNANGSVWFSGQDLGEGLGWKLQAGSILPVWLNQVIDHYIYSDATGATYRLDQNNGGVWTSYDSTYVAFNANNDFLYFPDGSFWSMSITSQSPEQDVGTIYPTLMEDTNGNQIQLTYVGASSRIATIIDSRQPYYNPTYAISYNYDYPPHLNAITNYVGTSENYTFVLGYQRVLEPFNLNNYSWGYVLNSAAVNGLNISHQFQYDSSAELTQVTTPLGGVLKWAYQNDYYTGSGRSYRAVQYRYLQAVSGGTTYQWNVQMDAAVVWHGVTTLQDVGASTQKVWNFSTNGSSFPGLATAYEEHDTTGVLLHKGYTWSGDISQAFGRPYVRTAVTKGKGDGRICFHSSCPAKRHS
jgi:YD repeat-containing protein